MNIYIHMHTVPAEYYALYIFLLFIYMYMPWAIGQFLWAGFESAGMYMVHAAYKHTQTMSYYIIEILCTCVRI